MKQIKPKFCINCKHFIPDSVENKYGKCELFPKIKNDSYFLVDAVNRVEDMDYYYCETARSYSDMCGKNGDFHKRKYIKKQN
jgi:hypothetical protein